MIYVTKYKSPIGNLILASKDNKSIGLWIKYFFYNLKDEIKKS